MSNNLFGEKFVRSRSRGSLILQLAALSLLLALAGGCNSGVARSGGDGSGGGGNEVAEGKPAPDFALPGDDGRTVKLSDYRGKQPVVLYFYPKDETPGCTKQACAFRDSFAAFREAGIEVLGVSVDTVESHKEFKQKQNLNFTLLADDKQDVSKSYGVLGTLGYASRVTFVIDKDGVVRKIYRDVDPAVNAAETLAFAKTL